MSASMTMITTTVNDDTDNGAHAADAHTADGGDARLFSTGRQVFQHDDAYELESGSQVFQHWSRFACRQVPSHCWRVY